VLEDRNISVIVMAYNEEPLVRGVLKATADALLEIPGDHEILFVDDASEDRSIEIAGEVVPSLPVPARVLGHKRNMGSGAVKRTGIEAAAGDLVIAIPCDNPLSSQELAAFAGAARVADIVCGYRPRRPGYTWRMLWGSRLYRSLIRILFGIRVRDAGWIKMYRRALHPWLSVRSDGVFNHVEMLSKARHMGLGIAEVPCPMQRRLHGVPSIARPDVVFSALMQTFFFWFKLKILRRQLDRPPVEVLALVPDGPVERRPPSQGGRENT